MFKCGLCGNVSEPREKPFIRILETRPKTYEYRKYRNNKITYGHEIVKEALLCIVCDNSFKEKFPDKLELKEM